MRPIDLSENNKVITPEEVKTPVGCGGTCGGKCGSKKEGTSAQSCGCGCGNCTCTKRRCGFVPALLIALGLGFAGWAIGCGISQISTSQRTVSVRGFSEREVKADLAIWNIGYVSTGNDLTEVQAKVESDSRAIHLFLITNGIEESEILELPTSMIDLMSRDYRSEGADKNRYIVNAGLRVRSDKVDIVSKLSGMKIGGLIRSGVTLKENQQPVYLYTKLKDIKPGMVAEATKDAYAAAKQFAKDSGASLGSMKSATQGVFQFLPRDQADSVMESAEINKTVRVVTTVNYLLKD